MPGQHASRKPIPRGQWIALTALLAASLAVRLYALDRVPAVLGHDECDNLVNVQQILNGRGPGLFGLDWKPQPAASVYLQSLFLRLEASVLSSRLPSALLSVAALIPFYLIARRAVVVPAALLGSILLATDIWYLHFSRMGWDNVFVCLPLLAALLCIERSLDERRTGSFAWTGLWAGLGAHGYFAGRAILPAALAVGGIGMIAHRGARAKIAAGMATTVAVATLLSLPMIATSAPQWEAFQRRTREVYLLGGENASAPLFEKLRLVRESFDRKVLQTFSSTGPQDEGYLRADGGPFTPASRILLGIGLLAGLLRWRATWRWWAFLLPAFGLTQVLTKGNLNGARGVILVPLLYLFACVALDHGWRLAARIHRLLPAALVAGVLALSVWTTSQYFAWVRSAPLLRSLGPSLPVSDFPQWQAFVRDWTAGTDEFFNLAMWEERKRSDAPRGSPNVLVYLVDTLRADALGAYGASENASPHFDALARRGVVFERAVAPSPWTLPSVVSLFTGQSLAEHGIVYGKDVLSDQATTLAERFRDSGYVTAAVTASDWPTARHGLAQGFDEVIFQPRPRGRRGVENGTSSARANEAVIPWLERHREKPFFLYVHVVDPHQPYTPPDELVEPLAVRWPENDRRWALARSPTDGRSQTQLSRVERLPPNRASLIIEVSKALYRAAVVHVDREFGRVMEALERLDLAEETILVVVADHGEEFLEHARTGHAHSLYREMIHVPLIIRAPGRLPAGKRIAEPVGLIDVAPTLLGLAGVPAGAPMSGHDLTEVVERSAPRTPRTLLAVARPVNPALPLHGVPDVDGVVMGRWKLLRNHGDAPGRAPWELFEWTDDASDRRNLASSRRDVVHELERALAQLTADAAPTPERTAAFDAAQREQLRALGYEP